MLSCDEEILNYECNNKILFYKDAYLPGLEDSSIEAKLGRVENELKNTRRGVFSRIDKINKNIFLLQEQIREIKYSLHENKNTFTDMQQP